MSNDSGPMSLKAFHIVFVTVSVILCVGFALWAIVEYRANGAIGTLIWGVVSLLAAVVLVAYGRWFLRKLKEVGDL